MHKFMLDNNHPNSAFKNYDTEIKEQYGIGPEYSINWYKNLTDNYFAEFGRTDLDERFVIIPDEFYTLFLLKYS